MEDEQAMIATVCAAFGVGKPVTVARVAAGYLNRDEAVTLADGQRLFLKGSRHRDARVVRAEHVVIAYAAAHGVPTPLPLAMAHGDTVAVVGGVPWSAFPFIAGVPLAGDDLPERLGALVGRVHRALVGCPSAGLTFAEQPVSWDTAATLAEMDRLEARAAARVAAGAGDAFDRWLPESFAVLREILRDAPPTESFAWLPAQVIHGDLYPPNVLCAAEGEPVAVLDWEFATVRPRVWDLVRALAFTFLGVHGDPPDHDAARRCVASYAAVQPLAGGELAAGIALYLWRTAHNLVKYRWHDERGPQKTDAFAPGDLALTRWLYTEGASFAAFLAESERE